MKWLQEFWVKLTATIAVGILTAFGSWAWGKHQGKTSGFELGYEEGKRHGDKQGHDRGYEKGVEEGKDRNKWYDEGRKAGETAGYDKGHESGMNEGMAKGQKAGYDEGIQAGIKTGREYSIQPFFDRYESHLADLDRAISIYKDNKNPGELNKSVNAFLEALKTWSAVIEKLDAFKNGPRTELQTEIAKEKPDYEKIQGTLETIRRVYTDKKEATFQALKNTHAK